MSLPAKVNKTLTILDLLLKGEAVTADEISDITGIPKIEVMRIMSDPKVSEHYEKITEDTARTEFNAVKYKTLLAIIQNSLDSDAKIKAIRAMDEFLNGGRTDKRASSGTIEGVIKDMDEEDEVVIGIQKRKFKGLS